MYQATLLLVVGVASLAAGDVSLLHSKAHHASPLVHSPVHHAGPIVHSPVHHAGSVVHSPLHHAGPIVHSPVHHAGSVVHSPVHHAGPIVHSPVHHASPVVHSPKVHGPVHHGGVSKHVQPVLHGKGGYGHETYHDIPAAYNYNYLIHDDYSGAHFGHDEVRDGYKTEGKYFVHLPDGRIQTVTYYADETGYHATVTYEGEAHYDEYVPKHAPTYAPKPAYHAPVDAYH